MRFIETPLHGLYLIEPELKTDERGAFYRTYCTQVFKEHGIDCIFMQDSISYNRGRNTLRGMHYQREPFGEDKLVRCIAGAVFDVAVDLREESDTYLAWFGAELTAENGKALFIPKGFAHGFQTLCDDTSLYYKISEVYHPEAAAGIAYNDPRVGIVWKDLGCEMTIGESDRGRVWL